MDCIHIHWDYMASSNICPDNMGWSFYQRWSLKNGIHISMDNTMEMVLLGNTFFPKKIMNELIYSPYNPTFKGPYLAFTSWTIMLQSITFHTITVCNENTST